MTDIGFMVRSANPVPDDSQQLTDDELVAVLLLAQQRSGNMDAKELTRPVEPDRKPKRNGLLVAAAAFAVVLGVVGITYLFSSPTGTEAPATTPSTTVAVTTTIESAPSTTVAPVEEEPVESVIAEPVMTPEYEQFIVDLQAAWNGDDSAAYAAFFAPSASRETSTEGLMIGRDKLLAEREYLRTQQTTHTLTECEPRSNGVSCVSTLDGPVEQALFGESLQSIVRYHLDEEGRITRMDARITTTISADDPWVKFTAWMEATHPSVAESMTAPVFGRDLAAYDDSAIWLEYAPLWAEAGRP